MALKVFDLKCNQGHVFEGWFNTSVPLDEQIGQGMLECPVCGSKTLERQLSASRINTSKTSSAAMSEDVSTQPSNEVMAPSSEQVQQLQAQVLTYMRQMVKKSENVGNRFADEALKMHRGESKERPIRGTATVEERQELAEEGVSVMPLPDFLDDDKLQ